MRAIAVARVAPIFPSARMLNEGAIQKQTKTKQINRYERIESDRIESNRNEAKRNESTRNMFFFFLSLLSLPAAIQAINRTIPNPSTNQPFAITTLETYCSTERPSDRATDPPCPQLEQVLPARTWFPFRFPRAFRQSQPVFFRHDRRHRSRSGWSRGGGGGGGRRRCQRCFAGRGRSYPQHPFDERIVGAGGRSYPRPLGAI